MFCPQCGQRQASNEVRFCSSCGFQLNVVTDLLSTGGFLPRTEPASKGPRKLSPRQKGLRQGLMLFLSTFLVVPIVAILSVFVFDAPELFVPIAAITCFIGGLLRMAYAVLLEENQPPPTTNENMYAPTAGVPAFMNAPPARPSSLPPQQSTPANLYQPPRRVNTGELIERPLSVTENTTRLLNKDLPGEEPEK